MSIRISPLSLLRGTFFRPQKVVGCVIAAVLTVVIGVVFIGAAIFFGYQRHERLIRLTAEAPAQVLEVKVISNDRNTNRNTNGHSNGNGPPPTYSTRITYSFPVDGRTIETEWTKSGDVSDEFEVGREPRFVTTRTIRRITRSLRSVIAADNDRARNPKWLEKPKESLSMWKMIVASAALMAGSVFAQPTPLPQERQEVATRFGSLTVNDDKALLFKGRELTPTVAGNNSLSLNDPIQMGEADVVLVQDNGGTACPSLYYFVTVGRTGARATKAFGTCADITSVKKVGDSIRVIMPGFRGLLNPNQCS